MKENVFKAFQDAHNYYPSDGTECYVPERGSYKAGFIDGARWAREEALKEVYNMLTDYTENVQTSRGVIKKNLAIMEVLHRVFDMRFNQE